MDSEESDESLASALANLGIVSENEEDDDSVSVFDDDPDWSISSISDGNATYITDSESSEDEQYVWSAIDEDIEIVTAYYAALWLVQNAENE